jgi:putative peptidoglycan lipid II flippase
MTLFAVIDQSMALTLGSGIPSALGYATKIVAFGAGVASVAVGAAVMPYFSHMVAGSEWLHLRRSLIGVIGVIALITVPGTIILALAPVPVVRLLFQRGAFTAINTAMVASVLQVLCLQIPFFVASIPISRAMSALRANHILAVAAGINIVLKCALNFALMPLLGVVGIALATSVVYAVSFSYLFWTVLRLLRRASDLRPSP